MRCQDLMLKRLCCMWGMQWRAFLVLAFFFFFFSVTIYIFLAVVFVEKLIVGCYRIRRAKAVSFECQSLIWVLELYPSVIQHSWQQALRWDRGCGEFCCRKFTWLILVLCSQLHVSLGHETPPPHNVQSKCLLNAANSWNEEFFIQLVHEQVKASRSWQAFANMTIQISNLQPMQQKSDS